MVRLSLAKLCVDYLVCCNKVYASCTSKHPSHLGPQTSIVDFLTWIILTTQTIENNLGNGHEVLVYHRDLYKTYESGDAIIN